MFVDQLLPKGHSMLSCIFRDQRTYISSFCYSDRDILHREEEPHNNHETLGRQTKQSNQLSLPYQDDYKTRMAIK